MSYVYKTRFNWVRGAVPDGRVGHLGQQLLQLSRLLILLAGWGSPSLIICNTHLACTVKHLMCTAQAPYDSRVCKVDAQLNLQGHYLGGPCAAMTGGVVTSAGDAHAVTQLCVCMCVRARTVHTHRSCEPRLSPD